MPTLNRECTFEALPVTSVLSAPRRPADRRHQITVRYLQSLDCRWYSPVVSMTRQVQVVVPGLSVFLKAPFVPPLERHAAHYARNINIIFLVCRFVQVRSATSAF